MYVDPWHGRPSLERGIAQALAALAARTPPFDVAAWLTELERREPGCRASTPLYERFDRHARTLSAAGIRSAQDAPALVLLEARLRDARRPGPSRLFRVWSRAELGELIVEATNRGRQLAAGPRRDKGPDFDPRRIPDERLELLIQRHTDMAVVDALRAERRRRQGGSGG